MGVTPSCPATARMVTAARPRSLARASVASRTSIRLRRGAGTWQVLSRSEQRYSYRNPTAGPFLPWPPLCDGWRPGRSGGRPLGAERERQQRSGRVVVRGLDARPAPGGVLLAAPGL